MTLNKTRISSKPMSNPGISNKPSTITRAGITADLKLTRGKQLVEHNPFSLIPDPDNPRPGEVINDQWLVDHLFLGTENSLCKFDETKKQFYIPLFSELPNQDHRVKEDDYNFLRDLAYSIRVDGLIEPIEIFLADKNNDPAYFQDNTLEYGYVVLEGHQRRLAAMMGNVSSVTCIEITDETMLAKLKVNHRKLRRQLSENNLRKNLTVAQNFLILKQLLKSEDAISLPVKELSSVVGLNEDIVGALRRACLQENDLPPDFINVIIENLVNFSWIRTWVGKSYEAVQEEINRLKTGEKHNPKPKPKVRGRQGGAVKKSAVFKINDEQDSIILRNFLLHRFPEIKTEFDELSSFSSIEKLLNVILQCAKTNLADPDRI